MKPTYGILSSSIDPAELSTTIQSVARTLAGLLLFAGVITTADSTTLLAQVNSLVTTTMALIPLGYAMWNAGETIFGILRKVLVAVSKKA